MRFLIALSFTCILLVPARTAAQGMYFPPLTGTAWDTLSPASLGWCQHRIDSLYAFLEQKNTKGFAVLKDGRLVLEKYFGTFTQDSLWYWASAGKTLTAFMVGQAQEQGFLDIDDSTSQYLGAGWTSLTPQQEGAITLRHQLTMTTGLNDFALGGADCTDPACLEYEADPGTRWAYHNAPYTLLREVLQNATGQNPNVWTNQQVGSRIGMSGLWLNLGWNNVYFSTVRGMARYGHLLLNRGIWDTDTLLNDDAYFTAMSTPSQSLNPSYGYLTWLNGQSSYMLPGLQLQLPGPLNPNAPTDMVAALGKNDQKIHVVPGEGLVVVRMGNSSDTTSLVPIVFDMELWSYINALSCGLGMSEADANDAWQVLPVADGFTVQCPRGETLLSYAVVDATGRTVVAGAPQGGVVNTAALRPGVHFLLLRTASGREHVHRFVR
ncbi:MAG: serine hydrolase [Flavobacteriales bacterium]|nr:MAG: serine hydrolase [Flavobacteriales bacterium]